MATPSLSNDPFYWLGESQGDHLCLFLHGLGGGVYELFPLARILHQAGYSVAGINYPGHDKPSFWMPPSHWGQWYEAIEKTLLQYQDQHKIITLIGFSTGCPLALHTALNHRVDRLVMLSPFLKIRSQWYYGLPVEHYVKALAPWVRQVPRKGLPLKDPEFVKQAHQTAFMKTFNLQSVHSALELIEGVKPRLADIEHPTLIIQSKADSVVCPSGAQFLYDTLGSQTKELVWLQDSDHIIPLDWEREGVNTAVLNFLCDI